MRRLLPSLVALVVLAVVAGGLWALLAKPAQLEAREQGIVLTEAASGRQFGVVVTFVLIGIVLSFGWAAVVAWRLPRHDWFLVPLFAVATGAASLVAWQVGMLLGPDDPAAAHGLAIGDTVSAQLAVDAVAPFLVWPLFALVGLVFVVLLAGDGGEDGADESLEIGRGQLDVESTPAARHENGRPQHSGLVERGRVRALLPEW